MTLPADAQVERSCTLIVSTGSKGLDLSQFRISFHTTAADVQTPNMAYFRVYNLKAETMQGVINEYTSVLFQAGYQNPAAIFQGNIIRFKRGKESNVDSYLDIVAADGDEGYNFGVISQSFAAGSSVIAQVNAIAASMGVTVDPAVYANLQSPTGATGGILPRGQVLYGMARQYMSEVAGDSNARWSIQNGVLTLIPLTGYLPGEAVVINSQTGMVGIPEATDNGIAVRILLNPLVKIGRRVQLNETDVANYPNLNGKTPGYLPGAFGTPAADRIAPFYVASVATDGFYRVMSVEHSGDTRGGAWYSDLICLAVDSTSQPGNSVKPY